jgi:hypothetical protein
MWGLIIILFQYETNFVFLEQAKLDQDTKSFSLLHLSQYFVEAFCSWLHERG